jgi:hypothetical protein
LAGNVVQYSGKRFFTVFLIVMSFLVVDSQISIIADIIVSRIVSLWGITLFVIISAVYVTGQYLMLQMVGSKIRQSKFKPGHIDMTEKFVTIIQYILAAITIAVVVELLAMAAYHTGLLMAATTISYGLTIFLMGMLTWRLFSWFKINKSLIVLLYGMAASTIIVNAVATILFFDLVLLGKAELTTPGSEVIFDTGYEPGTAKEIIVQMQGYSLPAYLLLIWGGTIFLLRNNIHRIGKIKFGVLVTFPVVYFLAYYIFLYPTLYPDSPITQAIDENFMTALMLGLGSTTISGILFGLGFLSVARFISQGNEVRDYMSIAGYGFMIFVTAAASTVLQAAYPPYGLPNVSFVGLAAFLILVGLHHSAISVAHDVKLRQLIRNSTIKESKLLDSIASAQMAEELHNKIMNVTKENAQLMGQKSGTEPSLTDDDIAEYVNRIIMEVKEKEKENRAADNK